MHTAALLRCAGHIADENDSSRYTPNTHKPNSKKRPCTRADIDLERDRIHNTLELLHEA